MDATYRIEGMTCEGCVRSVTNALRALGADLEVEVSLEKGTARVRGPHDADQVKRAVEDAGFDFGGAA